MGSYKVGPTTGNLTSYKVGPVLPGSGAQTFQLTSSQTANYAVTAADSGIAFDTLGAAAPVTFTLPAGVNGQIYTFTNATTNLMTVKATGTDVIQFPGSVTAAAGTQATSTKGGSVTLYFHTGVWFDKGGFGGTWVAT